jgi:hypothetical protein
MSRTLSCALLLVVAAHPPAPRPTLACVHYAPEIVRLTGRLSIDKMYGPPNFGENPATDEKLHVAILHLSHPLDVCGDDKSEFTSETFTGLQTVELGFANLRRNPSDLAGKRIAVRGTLEVPMVGNHLADMLMSVDSVRVIP